MQLREVLFHMRMVWSSEQESWSRGMNEQYHKSCRMDLRSTASHGETVPFGHSPSGRATCIGSVCSAVGCLTRLQILAERRYYGALTPHLDLVVITSRHQKGTSRVNSNSPYRPWSIVHILYKGCEIADHAPSCSSNLSTSTPMR